MKNDFLDSKKNLIHFDPNPKRVANGQFTFKPDSQKVKPTKVKNTSEQQKDNSNNNNQQSKKEKEDNPIKNIFDGIKGMSDSASKLLGNKKEEKFYNKYPDISDKELSEKLNRLRMEQQYSDLMGDTKIVKTGSEKAKDILQTIGAIAGIGVSLSVIIPTLSKLRIKK